MGAKGGGDVGVMIGARAAPGDVECGGQTQLGRGGNSRSVGNVGHDDSDLDVGEIAVANVVGDGEEVGAAAGEEYAETQRLIVS